MFKRSTGVAKNTVHKVPLQQNSLSSKKLKSTGSVVEVEERGDWVGIITLSTREDPESGFMDMDMSGSGFGIIRGVRP